MTGPGLDVSRVSPADAAVTLRSLPRRYRGLFAAAARPDDPGGDDLVRRLGPDGHAALDHLALATRGLVVIGHALGQVLIQDDPYLHVAVTDATAREYAPVAGHDPTAADLLGELATVAEALATRIERTPAGDWSRTGRTEGTTAVTALDLAREAVRTGIAHLKAAEATLAAVRGRG